VRGEKALKGIRGICGKQDASELVDEKGLGAALKSMGDVGSGEPEAVKHFFPMQIFFPPLNATRGGA